MSLLQKTDAPDRPIATPAVAAMKRTASKITRTLRRAPKRSGRQRNLVAALPSLYVVGAPQPLFRGTFLLSAPPNNGSHFNFVRELFLRSIRILEALPHNSPKAKDK